MADYGYGAVQQSAFGGQAPMFTGGNSMLAAEFSGKLEQFLTQQAVRADKGRGSINSTLLVPMANCFPKGTDPALWFDAVTGNEQQLYQAPNQLQPPVIPILEIYLLEWELHFMHSLTPQTVLADAAEYRACIYAALKALWAEDLRVTPPNLHLLIQHAHSAYLHAHPNAAGRDKDGERDAQGNHPLMPPDEAALRCDYSPDTFSNDYKRLQFYPHLIGLANRRADIYIRIATIVEGISDEWTRTRAFFSRESIDNRLTMPPLGPVKYLIACYRAQWVGITKTEHNMLLNCNPSNHPTYKSWLSEYKHLVGLTSSEPPLTRERLCEHFMLKLRSKYGDEIYNYVRHHYTGLNPTTRTVLDLYGPASKYHRDFLEQYESSSSNSSRRPTNTTPTKPRPEQSPNRGRTSYPSSPNRSGRTVSFSANAHDYYYPPEREHHHYRHPSPEPRHHQYHQRYHSPEPHSSYNVSSSSSSTYCALCKDHHRNAVCYYQTNPNQVPSWWAPESTPLPRLMLYLNTCQANGWEPRMPHNPSSRSIPAPTPISSATAMRPQSTRNVIPTTSNNPSSSSGRGRGGAKAPTYRNQPPPEQLRRQQEHEERHAGHHFDADEPQFETDFNAMLLEANPLTRAKVLEQRLEAAKQAAVEEPTAAAPVPAPVEAGAPEALSSAVPTPRLRREPAPVGFTADQLPRGLLPEQLPERQNPRLAVAQLQATHRSQALPLSTGVVPLAVRAPRGGGGLVHVPLQQLIDYGGLGEMFKEALPMVVTGVGTEQYAMDTSKVMVLMGAAQAVKVFGGREGGVRAYVAEADVALKEVGSVVGLGRELEPLGGELEPLGGELEPLGEAVVTAVSAAATTTVQGTIHTFCPPAVTCIEAGPLEESIALVHKGKVVARPRSLADSGANVNAITRQTAEASGAKFSKEQQLALKGAAKNPTSTLGRVTTEMDICLCLGTSSSVRLRLPLHVVDTGDNPSWDLLLGTGFLAAIGANIDFLSSTLTFRPELINTPNADEAAIAKLSTHTIPITTTTANPSAAYFRDLVSPPTGGGA
jgi:hypothetical protein